VRDLLKTNQAMFISEKKRNSMCFKFFDDYPEKIIMNFDKNEFLQETSTTSLPASQVQSTMNLAFVQPPFEVKTNKSKVDKKLIDSASNEIKSPASFLNIQLFKDLLRSFSPFILYFVLPTCVMFIMILVFIISKTSGNNRIKYKKENNLENRSPLIA
jgi:hypothetical protein